MHSCNRFRQGCGSTFIFCKSVSRSSCSSQCGSGSSSYFNVDPDSSLTKVLKNYLMKELKKGLKSCSKVKKPWSWSKFTLLQLQLQLVIISFHVLLKILPPGSGSAYWMRIQIQEGKWTRIRIHSLGFHLRKYARYCCIYICSGYSILRVLRRRKRAAYVYRTNLWMSARICWRFFAQFLLWKHAVICVFFWHGYCLVSRSVADPDNFCPAPDPSDIEVRIWLRIRLRIQILDIKKIEQF